MLQQERNEEVKRLLAVLFDDELAISEFSLYSIGVIVIGNDWNAVYRQLLRTLFVRVDVKQVCLTPCHLVQVLETIDEFGPGFDDAYQYVAATTRDLELVSFDDNFDNRDLNPGRRRTLLTNGREPTYLVRSLSSPVTGKIISEQTVPDL